MLLHHWISTSVVFLLTSAVFTKRLTQKLPEDGLSTQELIKYWGYPVETHSATTADGYILELHRIPHGKSKTTTTATSGNHTRPVVFLQHGLIDSSAAWVLNPPKQSFGFILADAGYDVWLGNIRGNVYTKKHTKWDVKKDAKKFWNFSFDEMSKYDLETLITKALSVARQDQLYYVGYSQGSLMAFAGLSENKPLQDKIRINFAFAPTTRLANVKTSLKTVGNYAYFYIKKLRDWLGFNEFFPSSTSRSYLERLLCSTLPKLCQSALYWITGSANRNLNKTRLPVYLSHLPAGTSVKDMLHFMQAIRPPKVFQKYDYLEAGNKKKYGTKYPPKYNLTKVTVPTVLVQGMQDLLATPKDVDWTASHLGNVIKRFQLPSYNHIDFVWGISANKDVYEKVIRIIRADLKGNLEV